MRAKGPERVDTSPRCIDGLVGAGARIARASASPAAIVLFNFPPNAGNTGTAANLSVFESLYNTLSRLRGEGYTSTSRKRRGPAQRVLEGNAAQYGALTPMCTRWCRRRSRPRASRIWRNRGPVGARAGQAADRRALPVRLGAQFGNVLVGVQPGFGYEGDPMRLLFERGFAPTHAFCRLLSLSARISAPTRCCISAPTARSSSCPASSRVWARRAGPSG
jgi:magnesium chelatase subunit H